ncbi:M23 family metallopeptidase [Solirubrobacter sp. CPCC 204708]|uniref:M23 family metallopeptidase n=1 Tax=Solirubrobacter deserti TaxID=2282478 RepID=A0ABT4RJ67_9ACTN|nr:M23 family metallopeptidase [Solirubrobacter deserti]MBE2320218.1 M23 family metallopeptidase [Solirubrobacter deserti]MDA0138396.1 M23 family metallopeptidase [Solirubrobacter deserti]
MPAPPAASAPVVASSPAAVARLDCVQACGTAGASRAGSLLRLRGKALAQADEVVFMGAPGDGDDVIAEALVGRKTSADVRVPMGAVSGPVAVVDSEGALTAPSVAPVLVEATPPTGPVSLGVRAPTFFYDAAKPATLGYTVHGAAPVPVTVDLARVDDGAVIAHWDLGAVAPEAPQQLTWNGLANRKVQRTGRYEFRVVAGGVAQPPVAFEFARDRFPILGKATFGTGTAAFGGGRGHQGHDVFAACGTPLVAAHGGVVKVAGYHGRAGHYLVIDNEGTGTDYAYMHLREAPLIQTGARVYTGQPIGFVGDSGHAHGCHLHFEAWTAPGWYSGGRPLDPLPLLRAWAEAS